LAIRSRSFLFGSVLPFLSNAPLRDPRAAKVVKKRHQLTATKLKDLLAELKTTADKLADHGYWPAEVQAAAEAKGGKKATKAGEYLAYEPDSELRDTENVPLSSDTSLPASGVIHDCFIKEVRPHVDEAWIALDKTVIGHEISFNKYFYQHKTLRSVEDVTQEILALEAETDGLLKALVAFVGAGA
jgi:type I restriction enzyme M protein